jgi:hypothetical protein
MEVEIAIGRVLEVAKNTLARRHVMLFQDLAHVTY